MQGLVFVVDDSDANLMVIASALDAQYNVLTIPSAEKLFSLLEKKRPNIILMDIEMPVIDGFEAVIRIKQNQNWSDITIVMLTGWIDDKVKARAFELGACEVIAKPVDVDALQECILKYIKL